MIKRSVPELKYEYSVYWHRKETGNKEGSDVNKNKEKIKQGNFIFRFSNFNVRNKFFSVKNKKESKNLSSKDDGKLPGLRALLAIDVEVVEKYKKGLNGI